DATVAAAIRLAEGCLRLLMCGEDFDITEVGENAFERKQELVAGLKADAAFKPRIVRGGDSILHINENHC
ncbi:MAG: hypothetical protein KAZ15_00330, partial [Comamonas sp.]|nr:hypothetical protein [Comamonas sp.]